MGSSSTKYAFGPEAGDQLEVVDNRTHGMGFAVHFTFREHNSSRLPLVEVGQTPFEAIAKMAGNKDVRNHVFPLIRLARHYQRTMMVRTSRSAA